MQNLRFLGIQHIFSGFSDFQSFVISRDRNFTNNSQARPKKVSAGMPFDPNFWKSNGHPRRFAREC